MISLGNRVHIFARPNLKERLEWCFGTVLGSGPAVSLSLPGLSEPVLAFTVPGGGSVSIEFTEEALDEERNAGHEPAAGSCVYSACDYCVICEGAVDPTSATDKSNVPAAVVKRSYSPAPTGKNQTVSGTPGRDLARNLRRWAWKQGASAPLDRWAKLHRRPAHEQ